MKKIFSVIIMLIIILNLHITNTYAATPPAIGGKAYVLVDLNTGNVLAEKNPDLKLYPASTTKIMTAMLALQLGNLDTVMTASKEAVNNIGKDGMNIGILPNEQLKLKDLVNAMLVRSANETANIIAENISGSASEFVKLMNKKAAEIGAKNTNFLNPCGRHEDGHVTTAKDLSIIAREAMKIPQFREIVKQKVYTMAPTNLHPNKDWGILASTNKLLTDAYYKNSNYTIIGVKTGYTSEAGNNLVSAARGNDGTEILAVVMDFQGTENGDNVYSASNKLLKYGFENFASQKVVDSNVKIGTIKVTGAQNEDTFVDANTAVSLNCVLPKDTSKWNIQTKIDLPDTIKAPVKAGNKLGTVEYISNGTSIGKVDLIASRDVSANIIAKTTKKISNIFLKILFSILALFILLICFRSYNIRKRRRRNLFNR